MSTSSSVVRTAAICQQEPRVFEGIRSIDSTIRELQVRIPVEHLGALEVLAEAHGISMASLARLVIRASLKTQFENPPRSPAG